MEYLGGNSCYSSHSDSYRTAFYDVVTCAEEISNELECRQAAEDILNHFSSSDQQIAKLAINYWNRMKKNPDEWYGAEKWAVDAFKARVEEMKTTFQDLCIDPDLFYERIDDMIPLAISEFRERVFYRDY